MEYDKDHVKEAILKKIAKYTKMENFNPDHIKRISFAGAQLCAWVRSIEEYAKLQKVVKEKSVLVKEMQAQHKSSQRVLVELDCDV